MNEQKELQDLLETLYGKRSIPRKFLEHEGWELIQESVKAQIMTRRQELLTMPINSLDSMILLATKRGELHGMEMMSASFRLTMDDYDHDIEVMSEQLKEIENASRRREDPNDGDSLGEFDA